MLVPHIIGLGTSVPPRQYSQDHIAAFLGLSKVGPSRHLYALFENSGVACRHTVVDDAYYMEERTTEARNNRYMHEALPLGQLAIQQCLDNASCDVRNIDDFFVVSCTGIEIPGLDLHLAGRLGMRSDLRRTCILGMGCYAAFPALLRAREAVMTRPHRVALVLTLELCSLHLQLNQDIENIVATALFGDGAAAALIRSEPQATSHAQDWPHLVDSQTHCDYQTLDHMAFHLSDHGFQMHLTAYVPDLLAAKIEAFVDDLLGRHHIARSAVRFWCIHPGSRKILDYVQQRLNLSDEQLSFSRHILCNYGNMSSSTVLFVLDDICRHGQPQPDDYGVMLAFGPGLTMESALVQW